MSYSNQVNASPGRIYKEIQTAKFLQTPNGTSLPFDNNATNGDTIQIVSNKLKFQPYTGAMGAISPTSITMGGNTVNDISIDGTMTANSDSKLSTQRAIKKYVDDRIKKLDPQEDVISFRDFTTNEDPAPTLNIRYINTVTGISNVTLTPVTIDNIYEWTGSAWDETVVDEGTIVFVSSLTETYLYTSSTWVRFGISIRFTSLKDTFSSFVTANGILKTNNVPDAVEESTTTMTDGLNNFQITQGTTQLDCQSSLTVSGVSNIDQGVRITDQPSFNNIRLSNGTIFTTLLNSGAVNRTWWEVVEEFQLDVKVRFAEFVFIGREGSGYIPCLYRFIFVREATPTGTLYYNYGCIDRDRTTKPQFKIYENNLDNTMHLYFRPALNTSYVMHIKGNGYVVGDIQNQGTGADPSNYVVGWTTPFDSDTIDPSDFYHMGQLHIYDTSAPYSLTVEGKTNLKDDVDCNASLTAGDLQLGGVGATVSEFDIDGTLASDSDLKVATQKATKKYVDDQIALHDSFLELNDTPATYTTANSLYGVNGATNGVQETNTQITEGVNTFTLTNGTSALAVTTSCNINQNLSTTSGVQHRDCLFRKVEVTGTPSGSAVEVYGSTEPETTIHIMRAIATATSSPQLQMCRSRGTYLSPTQILNGDEIATISMNGYDTNSCDPSSEIVAISTETFGIGSHGSKILFRNVKNTQTTLNDVFVIDQNGYCAIGKASSNKTLELYSTTENPTLRLTRSANTSDHYVDNSGYYHVAPSGNRMYLDTTCGLYLPTTGGTASSLDFHSYNSTFSVTWTGIYGVDITRNIVISRIGKTITLTFNGVSGASANNTFLTNTAGTYLPSYFRPAYDVVYYVQVIDNSVLVLGTLTVFGATGQILLYVGASGSTAFQALGNGGFSATSVSYNI